MLDSADASCLVMDEERLRGASGLVARAPGLFSDRRHSYPCYIKVGKASVNACLDSPLWSDL